MRHPVTVKLNNSRYADRNFLLPALAHIGDPLRTGHEFFPRPVSVVRVTMLVSPLCALQPVCFVSTGISHLGGASKTIHARNGDYYIVAPLAIVKREYEVPKMPKVRLKCLKLWIALAGQAFSCCQRHFYRSLCLLEAS